MKKHYETHVEDTDKLISVAGPILEYKSWYEQYRKLMEEQAQRKYGLYTPTSEGDDDDFPSIPGMIARYSALGLTNEQMKENPVWVDKTGNGHDLQMKNFLWGGMSGVGGYSDNFSSDSWKKPSDRSDITWTSSSFNITRVMNTGVQIYYFSAWEESESVIPEKRIIVKGLEDGQVLRYMNVGNRIIEISQDGIYTIPSFTFKGANSYHGYSLAKKQESCNVTVEQLPLYPGALVFDGVDDYGVCGNLPILTKEKGYTVVALRRYLSNKVDKVYSLVTNAPSAIVSRSTITFELIGNDKTKTNFSFGRGNPVIDFEPNVFSYMTSKSYNGKIITPGDYTEHQKRLLVGNFSESGGYGCNVAIWELVFLDHDATEEELTKIKDYFVKTYPWLFPDQAWTVTGKTNEDEDRATIANLTGNGNDLVLSNFGFSGNSGYGLYNIQKFTNWNHVADRGDIVKNGYSVTITNSKITGSSTNYNTDILYSYNSSSTTIIFKVTGLVDGQKIFLGRKSVTDAYVIDKDGIYRSDYNIPQEDGKVIVGIGTVGFTGECDITIEQIPEYEGYLVTDGVDDRVVSRSFTLNKNWTIVGNWKMLQPEANKLSGIVKQNSLFIYNHVDGLNISINDAWNFFKLKDIRSVNAICSDGRIYLNDWTEIIDSKQQTVNESVGTLVIGILGNVYTSLAFKNLSFYNNQNLSKDDCIKAYNYLQTLKAK
jgi:hypothetical protein